MIEAHDVTVRLAGKRIVSGIDFEARPGEISAIVGPNGSGKTTFLKALSGDLGYDGSIVINGREVSATRPVEAATMRAVLPQATSLAFPFTVHEIVRLGLVGGRSGVLAGETERLPERALAKVDLDGFPGASTRSFRAASSSVSSLPACSARSGRRCWMASRAICSSTSRFQAWM